MPEFERPSTRDLLTRFRAGDRDAFTDLYRTHNRSIYRFALLMTADAAKATEITQDVFVWLIHHPHKFDPTRGELSAFLIGVARKLLKHLYTEERKSVPFEESLFDRAADAGPDDGSDHDLAHLRQAIAALPPRYREVVVLCDLQEKTYEEASVIIECAVGTVRSRLHRARALLARKLTGSAAAKGSSAIQGCPA
ncbi:MAG TPA: sigma-70 family RNA polymerase sigma factor [Bryobacteraceae bacterium]|jgi:RNA polymerase sigma-70 factor (ECF subfamily)